jgi:WD40 repeat protein
LIAWITQNELKKFKSNAFAYFSEIQFVTDQENSFRLAEKAYITNKSNQRAAKMLLQSYFFLMKDIKMVTDISDNSEFATFSPVENKILTINRGNELILYDTNGNELKKFKKKVHEKKVFTAFFSPNGKEVVTTSEDKTARIWNLNGDLLKELKGHTDSVEYAVFSPDGKKVVTTSKDKTARIWNLETGKSIVIEEFNQPPTTASFSNDGKIILTSSDKICRFWNDSGKPFTDKKLIVNPGDTLSSTIPEKYSNVDFAKYSPRGNYIIAIGLDGLKGTVRIWDKNGFQFAPPIEINYGKASVFFSPDEKYITIVDADNWIKLKDLNGNDFFSTKWDEAKVISASCSINGRYIIITTEKNTVHLLALLGNKLREHKWGVNYAAFSPDDKYIITASEDGTAKLWDSKGKEICTITGHKGAVKFASFSPDSKKIVTASADHTIRMWGLLGNEIRVFKGHVGWVNSVVFSRKGDYLLSASGDGTVRLWDAENGNKIKVFKGSKYSWINYAEFSPDGNLIIIANEDGVARLLDLNGNEIAVLKGHVLGINYAAFSPCGVKIVTASDDKTIRLWDLYGNQIRKPLKVHSAGVNTVTFSPGGEYILSSSDDKTFYRWNLTENENFNIGGHSGRTKSAFFSFDGNYIISSSTDGTIKLWGMRPEGILQLANEYLRIKQLDNEQLKKYGLE